MTKSIPIPETNATPPHHRRHLLIILRYLFAFIVITIFVIILKFAYTTRSNSELIRQQLQTQNLEIKRLNGLKCTQPLFDNTSELNSNNYPNAHASGAAELALDYLTSNQFFQTELSQILHDRVTYSQDSQGNLSYYSALPPRSIKLAETEDYFYYHQPQLLVYPYQPGTIIKNAYEGYEWEIGLDQVIEDLKTSRQGEVKLARPIRFGLDDLDGFVQVTNINGVNIGSFDNNFEGDGGFVRLYYFYDLPTQKLVIIYAPATYNELMTADPNHAHTANLPSITEMYFRLIEQSLSLALINRK